MATLVAARPLSAQLEFKGVEFHPSPPVAGVTNYVGITFEWGACAFVPVTTAVHGNNIDTTVHVSDCFNGPPGLVPTTVYSQFGPVPPGNYTYRLFATFENSMEPAFSGQQSFTIPPPSENFVQNITFTPATPRAGETVTARIDLLGPQCTYTPQSGATSTTLHVSNCVAPGPVPTTIYTQLGPMPAGEVHYVLITLAETGPPEFEAERIIVVQPAAVPALGVVGLVLLGAVVAIVASMRVSS